MLEKSAMGIIFPNMHGEQISSLTGKRTMASVPVAGRYRMIDFALSAMTNAGVQKVGVVVRDNYQSLMDHIGNGREWDLSRKRDGVTIFPPYGGGGSAYHSRIEALHNILPYLEDSREELVIMTDCDVLCNVDYDELVEKHVASGADVTILYNREPMTDSLAASNVTLTMEADGRVTELLINDYRLGKRDFSMNLYVMSRELLAEIVKDAYSRNYTLFERDVLARGLKVMKVMGCEYTGYCSRISDMKSYFDANMALIDKENLKKLFLQERPVYTKVRDEAPVRYAIGCKVNNAILGDGCQLYGEVENCVLFRGVKIGKGAKVKNCILMQNTIVEENASMEYVICDKEVVIGESKTLSGSEKYPVFIEKRAEV